MGFSVFDKVLHMRGGLFSQIQFNMFRCCSLSIPPGGGFIGKELSPDLISVFNKGEATSTLFAVVIDVESDLPL